MIVREDVVLRRSELAKREREADDMHAQSRRLCFIVQIIAGVLIILLQLADVIAYLSNDDAVQAVTRDVASGLWAGAVFVIIAGIHLVWKPQTTAALTISIVAQVFVIIVIIILLFFIMWPLTIPDIRIHWPGYVVAIYCLMLAPGIAEVVAVIISLRSTASKWLRSQGYLEEGTRDHSLLQPQNNVA